DFRRALTERFGAGLPVFATRGEVDLSIASDGSHAVTTVSSATHWRRFGDDTEPVTTDRGESPRLDREHGSEVSRSPEHEPESSRGLEPESAAEHRQEAGPSAEPSPVDARQPGDADLDQVRRDEESPMSDEPGFDPTRAEPGESSRSRAERDVPVAERGPEVRQSRRSRLIRPVADFLGRGPVVLSGLDAAGETRSFRRGDVVRQPLLLDGQTIGVTFRSGDGPVEVPVSAERGHVFHVDVDGGADGFRLRLRDGGEVSVDSSTLARIVTKSEPLRSLTGQGALAAIALPGTRADGVAQDFRQALTTFGRQEPVVAPDGASHWRAFTPDTAVLVHTADNGRVRLSTADHVQGVRLTGTVSRTGEQRSFGPEDVLVGEVRRDGRLLGLSFAMGVDRSTFPMWANPDHPGQQITHTAQGGPVKWVVDQLLGRDNKPYPVPWPDNPFYIAAHASPRSFQVYLADGTVMSVDGTQYGRLVGSVAAFRSALGPDERRAIVLISCSPANTVEPGGAAHDFQRTLAAEFGYRQPVVGATQLVMTSYLPSLGALARGRFQASPTSTLANGGVWRTLASGPSALLGTGPEGRTHYVEPAEVRSSPLVQDGQTVGASFERQPAALPPLGGPDAPWPSRAFHVTASLVDGEFSVRMGDGRPVLMDGRSFAKVVADSEALRAALDGHRAQALVLHVGEPRWQQMPDDADVTHLSALFEHERKARGEALDAFRQAISRTFGYERPVFTPEQAGGWRQDSVRNVLTAVDDAGGRHLVLPSDLRVAEVTDGENLVGLSYAPATPPDPARLPHDSFAVHFTQDGDARVRATLLDGTEITLNTDDFVRVLTKAKPLRDALPGAGLLVVSGGDDVANALHDKLEERGWNTPAMLVHSDGVHRLVDADGRLLGTTLDGRPRPFRIDDVVLNPLVDGERTIGVSVRGGDDLVVAQRLADEAPRSAESFVVVADSVPSRPGTFPVSLSSGAQIVLDAPTLARVVAQSEAMVDALGGGREPDGFVLAAARAALPGGGAEQFQRVLADEFGYPQPLSAPFGDVDLGRAGDWRTFTSDTAPRFVGADHFGVRRVFDPDDVMTSRLTRDGLVVGMSFRRGEQLREALDWAERADAHTVTHLLDPELFDLDEAVETGELRTEPSPWPQNSFFVDTAAANERVPVILEDGTVLRTTAPTFAALVMQSLELEMADGSGVGGFVLLSSSAAGGGVARDFQQALAERFGRTEPVFAPTDFVELL
ncbi:MAG: hypothetical protein QOF58_2207, partial [Pseudonocardiales bacterium]|nr:hypothetical protein [Pseudonocardiales bacterium]